MTTALQSSLQALRGLLDTTVAPGGELAAWRWSVRQTMASLRELLAAEHTHPRDSWLAAREMAAVRERNDLRARIATLTPAVMRSDDVDGLVADLRRLLGDVARHQQRVNDLAYDDVEMELGGSE